MENMKEKFKDMEDRMRTSDINLIGGLEVEDRENGRYIISVAESFSEPMERPKSTDLGNTAHPWKDNEQEMYALDMLQGSWRTPKTLRKPSKRLREKKERLQRTNN